MSVSANPNYLSTYELAGYSAGRMGRKRGPLEERLWRAVILEIRGHRGRNKEVAAYIGRTSQWVSEFMSGRQYANLDTALALMRYLGWSLNVELRQVVVSASPEVLAACRDPEMLTLVSWLTKAKPEERKLAIQLAAVATGHESDDLQASARTNEPRTSPSLTTTPRKGRDRRR